VCVCVCEGEGERMLKNGLVSVQWCSWAKHPNKRDREREREFV